MTTVLLTAAGSASASSVLSRYRAMGCRVVACDIYPRTWNVACMEADAFFQAVPAADPDAYLAQLLEKAQDERVDFLIPLTDVEVDVLCARKADFAALGCAVCAPDEPAARLCRNKRDMAASLASGGICRTIPTFSPYGHQPQDGDFPLMLKPVAGRSSQAQVVAHDRAQYLAALSTRDDYIAQPFIRGDVYTVDVARDALGNVQALCRRELLRTPNGLGTAVRVLPGHPLEQTCAAIAAHIGLVGVVNMEFIGSDDAFSFLEVNPRFSGGVGFSIEAGVDFAALQLRCHQGLPIGPRPQLPPMTLARGIRPVVTQKG